MPQELAFSGLAVLLGKGVNKTKSFRQYVTVGEQVEPPSGNGSRLLR